MNHRQAKLNELLNSLEVVKQLRNQPDLIPVNGVHITEGEYPKGFYVAKYDADGFTSAPRWFPTMEKAQAYAQQIAV